MDWENAFLFWCENEYPTGPIFRFIASIGVGCCLKDQSTLMVWEKIPNWSNLLFSFYWLIYLRYKSSIEDWLIYWRIYICWLIYIEGWYRLCWRLIYILRWRILLFCWCWLHWDCSWNWEYCHCAIILLLQLEVQAAGVTTCLEE